MSTQIGIWEQEQATQQFSVNEKVCLSLTQPYASLVVLGEKRWETRSWPCSYRGPLFIHASKAMPKWCKEKALEAPFIEPLLSWFDMFSDLPLGFIIGYVDLVECIPTDRALQFISKKEESFGDYGPHRYAWRLENPVILQPFIPAKGQLGLWKYREPAA